MNVMIDQARLKSAFEELGLSNNPVLAHASLKKLGLVHGGAKTVLHTMLESFVAGILPEVLPSHPSTMRTSHPILSFAGVRADAALDTQTLYNPLAPIGALAEDDGWVLLIGVDPTVNTSIHYAQKIAGGKECNTR